MLVEIYKIGAIMMSQAGNDNFLKIVMIKWIHYIQRSYYNDSQRKGTYQYNRR